MADDRVSGGTARSARRRAPGGSPSPSSARPHADTTQAARAWPESDPARLAEDRARSGVPLLTGHRGGPPLLPPGGAATLATQLADHVAAAGGARLDGARLLTERAALGGRGRQGRLSVGGSCRLLPTRNGWATVSDARPDDPLLWSALIGRDLEPGALPGRLADWLAAHDGAELDERVELLSLAGGTVRPRTDHACPRPAEPRGAAGLLVVDFSALWAGPLCAHLLGTAGARVVKVETPSRPDGARFGDPAFYDLLHAGHASVVLDPTGRPTGRVWRADEWLRERLPEAAAPSLAAVGRRLARHGITAVTDATPRLTERSVDALATEARSGRLSQRLRLLGAPLGTPTGRTADAWPREDRPRGLRAAGLSAVDRRDRRRTPARLSGVRAHCHGRLARPAACSTGADRRAPR
ncbi:CoA transferase [Streptomyces sp. NBC_00268]|uniref:CoA transferase n=1 Tax=Streptomyces sp. NBC_00268 TaxID=2975695 RepID=UPI00225492EC|nr:CoA transferase [Streptomyces sp. NBC_00268]MCX5190797.1 CoA transferase [Streptomyces sp. NBC_00268]